MSENTEEKLEVFNPFRAGIAEMNEQNKKLHFDITTAEGERDARSWIHRLRRMKTPIVEAHKSSKQEALRFGQALDALKRELIDEIDIMIDVHYAPIKARDDEIAAEVAAGEARLQAEAEERQRLIEEQAEKIARLEADEKRRVREEQIAKDAAAKATTDAQNAAAKAIQDAEERAQREIDDEKARVKREQDAAEDKKRREDRAEAQHVADLDHREQIEDDVIYAFENEFGVGIDTTGTELMQYIRAGKIKHVKIEY